MSDDNEPWFRETWLEIRYQQDAELERLWREAAEEKERQRIADNEAAEAAKATSPATPARRRRWSSEASLVQARLEQTAKAV